MLKLRRAMPGQPIAFVNKVLYGGLKRKAGLMDTKSD
jgi:hypothetical protein